jgi:hypothetical protein
LLINRSDWLARLTTNQGVMCATRGGDILFSRQHTFGMPGGTRKSQQ